jgi:hypothetical protein
VGVGAEGVRAVGVGFARFARFFPLTPVVGDATLHRLNTLWKITPYRDDL